MTNKQFVKQETKELIAELKDVQQRFMDDKIDWETYLLLKIKAYREYVKQTNNHIK